MKNENEQDGGLSVDPFFFFFFLDSCHVIFGDAHSYQPF